MRCRLDAAFVSYYLRRIFCMLRYKNECLSVEFGPGHCSCRVCTTAPTCRGQITWNYTWIIFAVHQYVRSRRAERSTRLSMPSPKVVVAVYVNIDFAFFRIWLYTTDWARRRCMMILFFSCEVQFQPAC